MAHEWGAIVRQKRLVGNKNNQKRSDGYFQSDVDCVDLSIGLMTGGKAAGAKQAVSYLDLAITEVSTGYRDLRSGSASWLIFCLGRR